MKSIHYYQNVFIVRNVLRMIVDESILLTGVYLYTGNDKVNDSNTKKLVSGHFGNSDY